MANWQATERLYLNAARDKVLREGEPGATSLLCGVGAMLTEDVCRRWGLGPFAPVPAAGDDVGNAGPTTPTDDQTATAPTEATQNDPTGDSEGSADSGQNPESAESGSTSESAGPADPSTEDVPAPRRRR